MPNPTELEQAENRLAALQNEYPDIHVFSLLAKMMPDFSNEILLALANQHLSQKEVDHQPTLHHTISEILTRGWATDEEYDTVASVITEVQDIDFLIDVREQLLKLPVLRAHTLVNQRVEALSNRRNYIDHIANSADDYHVSLSADDFAALEDTFNPTSENQEQAKATIRTYIEALCNREETEPVNFHLIHEINDAMFLQKMLTKLKLEKTFYVFLTIQARIKTLLEKITNK